MPLLAAFVRRDWRIERARRFPFILDVLAVIVSATLFYYLGRSVSRGGGTGFFAFAVAGLAIVRMNTAVPRILALTTAEIAGGRLEILMSGSRPPGLVTLATAAFEILRAVVLAAGMIVLAVAAFRAPFAASAAGILAVVTGLALAAVVFTGLAAALMGMLMVVREAGAIGSLMSVVLPVVAGAYFPVRTLPQPLATVAAILPFRGAVDVIRAGLLDGRFPAGTAAALAIEAAAVLGIGLLLARAGVEHARRASSLGLE